MYWNLPILICLILLSGFPLRSAPKETIIGFDGFGRKIVLTKKPERIVVVSGTPIPVLFELGVGDKIIGVPNDMAKYYPEVVRRYPSVLKKTQVGMFSSPNIEKIVSLNPDIIICYDSVDSPGKYTQVFKKWGLPYAAFGTPKNITSSFENIKQLGRLLGKEKEAERLVKRIKQELDEVVITSKVKRRPLVYFWFGSGNYTYGKPTVANELIELAGGINLAGKFNLQYPQLSPEYVVSKNPDVIIISYWDKSQREARVQAIKQAPGFDQVNAVKNNRIYTIDGNSVHTPVRFAEAVRNLTRFIHPELFERSERQEGAEFPMRNRNEANSDKGGK